MLCGAFKKYPQIDRMYYFPLRSSQSIMVGGDFVVNSSLLQYYSALPFGAQ